MNKITNNMDRQPDLATEDLPDLFRSAFPDASEQYIAAKIVNFLETQLPPGGYPDEEMRISTAEWMEELKVFAGDEYHPAVQSIN